MAVDLPIGHGCEWATIGDVPRGPGLYAFTVETGNEPRVAYVGLALPWEAGTPNDGQRGSAEPAAPPSAITFPISGRRGG